MIKIHGLQVAVRSRGLRSFLSKSKKSPRVLDVGCGNGSSIFIKTIIPSASIYGLDICDYNQTEESKKLYENYILTSPDNFHLVIEDFNENFDLIISNHNIEHCNNPHHTFSAMVDKLAPGGRLFIATPSISSVNFPSRDGTLNFYDDKTHKHPVDLWELFENNRQCIDCIFYSKNYRPFFWSIVGLINEFFSKLRKKNMLGTWDYYGFEQIIWIKKN
jgi:SAM-dependent methyltransferase